MAVCRHGVRLLCRLLLLVCVVLTVGALFYALPLSAEPNYRQPAYITNAYFSDKMTEEESAVLRPLAVVKTLNSRSSGVMANLILDLMPIKAGVHHFKVHILNPEGEKMTDLTYPPVQVAAGETPSLYTVIGAVSGQFSPGAWFFKVFDQVNEGKWLGLGTFAIMVRDSGR